MRAGRGKRRRDWMRIGLERIKEAEVSLQKLIFKFVVLE